METISTSIPNPVSPEQPQQTSTLDERTKAFAATNDPALSPDSFTLGPKTFPIVFLKYKDQITFISQLQPLLTMFTPDSGTPKGLEEIVSSISVGGLMKYCLTGLPEMVALICRNTDPTITVDYVTEHAVSPFQLCGIILQQVAMNNMLGDIISFFRALRPLKAMFQNIKAL
jgi:hypothetical protein